MTIFATLQAFFQALTEFLRLKNKTAYFDLLEKFDFRLDKLDKERQIARSQTTTESQNRAEEILSEIIEEKQKLTEVKKIFNK